jgi:HAD superfamily hydrolase (TIGR01509 family)
LVDSERLCNQAFLDLLPEIDESVESLTDRYRGRKLDLILADLEVRLGIKLPEDFEQRYRGRVSELFENELEPTSGAREMLEEISFARCIASSGPPAKIKLSLKLSGLQPFFGNDVFSSYDVGSWKPDPGLFLHAAEAMNFEPEKCVVIEDSAVGIEAALAAGMRALHYSAHAKIESTPDSSSFNDMAKLPDILNQLASGF